LTSKLTIKVDLDSWFHTVKRTFTLSALGGVSPGRTYSGGFTSISTQQQQCSCSIAGASALLRTAVAFEAKPFLALRTGDGDCCTRHTARFTRGYKNKKLFPPLPSNNRLQRILREEASDRSRRRIDHPWKHPCEAQQQQL
jgi:hypothetical protein